MSKHSHVDLRLSERQQLLLSKFRDGECNLLQSFLAKRLVASNREAQDFLSQLEELNQSCKNLSVATQLTGSATMWERVRARIEQEERSELYLGRRRVEQPKDSLWERMVSPYALAGSLSGAALAVGLLTVVYRPSSITSFSAPQTVASSQLHMVRPVAIEARSGGRQILQVPRIASNRPLEVDWVRSHGSLKLIPDSSGASAIIWVRRKSESVSGNTTTATAVRSLRSTKMLAPTGRLVITPPPRQHLGRDELARTR